VVKRKTRGDWSAGVKWSAAIETDFRAEENIVKAWGFRHSASVVSTVIPPLLK